MHTEKKTASKWPGYVGLLVGVILIAYLFSKVDLKSSARLIGSIGFSSLLIPLPFLLLHLIETAAWQKLFPPGLRPTSFFKLFKIQVVSETISMTLPAGVAVGEPLRPLLCRRFLGIPLPDGFASVAVRKLLLGMTQGIYTLIGVAAGFAMLQEASVKVIGFGGLGIYMALAGVSVTLVFLLMLILVTNGKAVQNLYNILMKVPISRVREWLVSKQEGFAETDRKLQNVKSGGLVNLLPVLALYIVAWMMLAFESYLILSLLGLKVTFMQVLAFDTALVLLRAIFFFIPSGLGIQDLGYLAFFQAIGLPDYLAYGGAFVLLRRLKEVVWYSIGYTVMFTEGIHLQDAQQAGEEGA